MINPSKEKLPRRGRSLILVKWTGLFHHRRGNGVSLGNGADGVYPVKICLMQKLAIGVLHVGESAFYLWQKQKNITYYTFKGGPSNSMP